LVPDDADSGHTPVEAGSPEAANDYSLRFLFSVVFAMGAQTKEEFIAELSLLVFLLRAIMVPRTPSISLPAWLHASFLRLAASLPVTCAWRERRFRLLPSISLPAWLHASFLRLPASLPVTCAWRERRFRLLLMHGSMRINCGEGTRQPRKGQDRNTTHIYYFF
jgi:hypothetical protein